MRSTGGILIPGATTLDVCQYMCQDMVDICYGIDFNANTGLCYALNSGIIGQNLVAQSGFVEYQQVNPCASGLLYMIISPVSTVCLACKSLPHSSVFYFNICLAGFVLNVTSHVIVT